MVQHQKRRGGPLLMIELTIIMLIVGLMVFLINFANRKLDQVFDAEQEALLMSHDPNSPIHNELAQEIVKFRPDACKMIEVYSKELEALFKVQFLEEDTPFENDISKYPELMNLLKSNAEGHTSIIVDDKDEDVYFRWTESSTGDPYLVIIYMSRPVVKNFWVFSCICYMILFLIAILVLLILYNNQNKNIQYYHSLSQEIQSIIMRD